jgi:enoyl-CoA hydratase
MNDTVLTEARGGVLLITLNRPDALNAVNADLASGLLSAVTTLDESVEFTAGVLTGNGRGFCSGMDLKAFALSGPPAGFDAFLRDGCRKPLIAAVEGFALAGGLEIALTCDLLVAARGVKLGIPEARVGLFAAGGALFRLPRRIPYGIAMEMALTAEPITADRAHELGLVAHVTEPGQAVAAALELAGRIARNGPLAVIASKQLIRNTSTLPESDAWRAQEPLAAKVFNSQDAQEGPRAFAERRTPVWVGA